MVWAVTSKGSLMPIDPDPVAGGNVILDGTARHQRSGREYPAAFVLAGTDTPLGDPARFVSHFATCPNAERFRRPR